MENGARLSEIWHIGGDLGTLSDLPRVWNEVCMFLFGCGLCVLDCVCVVSCPAPIHNV